ncbi:peptide-methionine (S)-S-oxide reductase [Metamycoplasma phocicerebrale]|uniref:Peptide methionine sulfoxide reductase MsrA n=1 Tax=Metamycoplasma phocicerebrale TaxID=142649 RepID=A0A3T0TTX7_9BACT|nr:peptide-methionine (S)-S-oxide reductase MsrA [Metamycoplasma phocicerebrale]AZZ65561.1 peptide-methionine (S)-S-oxide reductase [Metamycoplasma phocicerebrale]
MNKKTIYIAGGCFWGTEAFFKKINGVLDTTVGYANSIIKNPNYEQVKTGNTNAVETVKIIYNADILSLQEIITKLFSVIDPTALNYQGGDYGTQYRNGIYYENLADEAQIKKLLNKLSKCYSKPLATELKQIQNFYEAEEYHQDYLDKHPNGYCHIKLS